MFLCLFVLLGISTHKRHHMMRSFGLIIARAQRNIPARVKSRKSPGKQDEDKPGGMCPLQSCGFSKSLSEALRTRDAESLCMQGGSEFIMLEELLSLLWSTLDLNFGWRRHVSGEVHVALLDISALQRLFLPTSSCSFPWSCHGQGRPLLPSSPH